MQLKSLCMDCSYCSDSCESSHVYAFVAYTRICAHMRLSVHVSVTTVGCRVCGCNSHTSFSINLTVSTVVFASACVKLSVRVTSASPEPYVIAFI